MEGGAGVGQGGAHVEGPHIWGTSTAFYARDSEGVMLKQCRIRNVHRLNCVRANSHRTATAMTTTIGYWGCCVE